MAEIQQPQQTEVDFPYFEKKALRLRFHFDEYLELETRTGRPPTEFVGNLMKLSPSDLRLAVWVGLKWQEPQGVRKTITLEWVQKQLQKHLSSGKSLMPILRALDEAFTASGYFTPEQKEEDGDPKAPPSDTGGESSGSNLRVMPHSTMGSTLEKTES